MFGFFKKSNTPTNLNHEYGVVLMLLKKHFSKWGSEKEMQFQKLLKWNGDGATPDAIAVINPAYGNWYLQMVITFFVLIQEDISIELINNNQYKYCVSLAHELKISVNEIDYHLRAIRKRLKEVNATEQPTLITQPA